MTAVVERIRIEASQLPEDEREALVRVLELDLEATGSLAEVEAEWNQTIEDRVEQVSQGTIKLIPFSDVEAEMEAFVTSLDNCLTTALGQSGAKRFGLR